jgi:hypothetical protein
MSGRLSSRGAALLAALAISLPGSPAVAAPEAGPGRVEAQEPDAGPASAPSSAPAVRFDSGPSADGRARPDSRALPAWAPRLAQAVEPAVAVLGDPIKITLRVRHAKSVSVNLPLQLELGKFSELSRSEAVDDLSKKGRLGEVEHRFVLQVAAYEVGELTLPPIEVTALGPGGELVSLQTGPVPVRIKGVLGNEPTPKLRGLEPPVSVFARSWLLLFLLVGLAAAGVIVTATLLVSRRLRARREAERPPPPPIPAHVTALLRLAAIDLEAYVSGERYKELYLLLSEIVRAYAGGRYGFDALEMTSTEINDSLSARGVPAETRSRFEAYFTGCDLVKFAKYLPRSEDARRAREEAEVLVRSTAEPPAPATAAPAPTPAAPSPPTAPSSPPAAPGGDQRPGGAP